MFASKRTGRAAVIEHLELRQLLSTGYLTTTVANFDTVGLKNPDQTVVRDSAGDIFGIAQGGANSDGAIWEIPVTTKALTVVAPFDGTNGEHPTGGLFKDANGNIYGVTDEGGTTNQGTLWELLNGQTSITVLGSFDSTTGPNPAGQVFVDSSGNVFGAATGEVDGPSFGNIWEYNASNQTITDLADFTEFTTGANPYGGVISDGNGNLYGTTLNGGSQDLGTVWKYVIGSSSITPVSTFTDPNSTGANPEGGIAIDASGDLFGTTTGEADSSGGPNQGVTVWEVVAGSNAITTLSVFPNNNANFFFGANPMGPVILDSNGDVVGTAEFGGTANQGDVWAIHPGGIMQILHSFTFSGGHDPDGSLLLDNVGDIFGTTQLGAGEKGDGTAFVMIPPGNIPATHVAFTVQPVNTDANGNFTANVQVSVEGAGNKVVTSDSSAVTLSIAKGPATATLGGTVTVDAIDGVATFTGLTLDAAGSYTLLASDGTLKSATSKPFMVPVSVHLVVGQQGSEVAAGAKMSTQIAIDVEDQFGKPLTTSHTPVKLAIESGPTLAKLAGNSAPPVAGVATFKTLSTTKAGSYTLTASDGTATPLTLDPFTVDPATASKMIFSTQPVATTQGTPFSVAVELFDKYGNAATNDTSDVTLSLAAPAGSATLGGTLSETVIDGFADFSGLTLDSTGTYTLLAADSGAIKPLKSVKFAVT